MFKEIIRLPVFLTLFVLASVGGVFCQGGGGTSEIGKNKTPPVKPPNSPPNNPNPKPPAKPAPKPAAKTKPTAPPTSARRASPNQSSNSTAKDCSETALLVSCALPECNVLVDGKSQGITDLKGEIQISVARGRRNIVVSKNGYETAQATANVACGALETVKVALKSKPFDIKVKTTPSDCDIFINDRLVGKSDANGFYNIPAKSGTVYVQARKEGYLSDSLSVSPAAAQKEILLKLKPLPALVTLNAKAKNAFAQLDGDEKKYDLTEVVSVEPGRRKLTVTALGYAPLVVELDLKPAQKVEKTIVLDALPVDRLLALAESYLKNKSPAEALELCRAALEAEPENASAKRLTGTIYLEKQDYAKAEPFLLEAMKAGETIELKIRRHTGEKFELTGGHDACAGFLILSKNAAEYRGSTGSPENFKAAYSQIQTAGIQLKKNAALYLSLKVADAKGGKKDYNFYFYAKDKELTQEGKPYLEMIQRLIAQNR